MKIRDMNKTALPRMDPPYEGCRAHEKGRGDVELWNLPLAAVFFCAMGIFAGVAALYLTSTPFRPLGHQAAEIVSFLSVVRSRSFCRNRPVSDRTQREKSHETEVRTTNRRFPPQPSSPRQRKRGLARNRSSSYTRRRAAESRDDLASRLIGHPRYAFGSGVFI